MATAAISNRRRKVLLRLPLGFLLRAGVIFFPQYVPSRHTQKAGIGCYRPPFGLRKAHQLFHGDAQNRGRIGTGGAGMVENVAPAVVLDGTLAKVDHTVIRLRARVLAKEQQVARHGGGEYAADQMRVQVVDRPHVGELGEGGGVQVRRLERPFAHAKQRGAQGRKRILILGDGIERRRGRSLRGGGPGGVVGVQRFAIGVADQPGAILDLGRAGRGRLEVLRLREPGEPAAESLSVGVAVRPLVWAGRAAGGWKYCASASQVSQRRKACRSRSSSRRRKSGVPSCAVSRMNGTDSSSVSAAGAFSKATRRRMRPGRMPGRMRASHLPGVPVTSSIMAACRLPATEMAGALLAALSMTRVAVLEPSATVRAGWR